jgi:hypothetical protein
MDVKQLLDNEGTTGAFSSEALKIGDYRLINGAIPVMVYGTFTGTVQIEGTIATDEEVADDTAEWMALVGGSFTSAGIMALFTQVSHIRATIDISDGGVSVRSYL